MTILGVISLRRGGADRWGNRPDPRAGQGSGGQESGALAPGSQDPSHRSFCLASLTRTTWGVLFQLEHPGNYVYLGNFQPIFFFDAYISHWHSGHPAFAYCGPTKHSLTSFCQPQRKDSLKFIDLSGKILKCMWAKKWKTGNLLDMKEQ